MNTLGKVLKTEYGNSLVVQKDGQTYIFRAPTLGEISKYFAMIEKDSVAARIYICDKCCDDSISDIPIAVVDKFLEMVSRSDHALSHDGYKESGRKMRNPYLSIMFNAMYHLGIPMSEAKKMTVDEFVEVLHCAEESLDIEFLTFDNEEFGDPNTYKEALTKAKDKINSMKKRAQSKPTTNELDTDNKR